jgi:monoamine oxidase
MKMSRRSFIAGGAAALMTPSILRSVAYAQGGSDLDVIVLGAGLSGLGTAALLEEAGLRVCVLEGRTRVGGRVLTRFDLPGQPELGGNTASTGYGRWLDTARRCKVELQDVFPRMARNADQLLVLDGKIISRDEWVRSPRNVLPGSAKAVMPWAYLQTLYPALSPLQSPASWFDPSHRVDDISLHDFLVSKGVDESIIDLTFNTVPGYGDTAHDMGSLMFAFIDAWTRTVSTSSGKPVLYTVKGGNQRLPEAMAAALRGPVRLGARVVAIESGPSGASVTLDSGERVKARAVVSSLPFSALRYLHITPGLSGVQHEAVHQLGYQNMTQMIIVPRKPFWLEDGLAPSMWTDGPAGWIAAERYGPTGEGVSSLLAWGRGRTGLQWDRMGPKAASEMVLREIESIRPAAKGQLEVAAVHSWSLDPWNVGDMSVFKPGQVTRFLPAMAKPHQRLFFCGEHTALANRGMEAALESAERAAIEVLDTLE